MKNMKTMVTCAALTFSMLSYAGLRDKMERNWNDTTGISKLYYGHTNEAGNLGLSHERREGALGIEAMIFASSDNGETGTIAEKDKQETLALSLIHHLHDNSQADVFLGTGISYTRHEEVMVDGEEEDVNSIGPMFKVGSNYYFNNSWSLGLEYIAVMNWSSDDVAAEQSYGFLTLGYTY